MQGSRLIRGLKTCLLTFYSRSSISEFTSSTLCLSSLALSNNYFEFSSYRAFRGSLLHSLFVSNRPKYKQHYSRPQLQLTTWYNSQAKDVEGELQSITRLQNCFVLDPPSEAEGSVKISVDDDPAFASANDISLTSFMVEDISDEVAMEPNSLDSLVRGDDNVEAPPSEEKELSNLAVGLQDEQLSDGEYVFNDNSADLKRAGKSDKELNLSGFEAVNFEVNWEEREGADQMLNSDNHRPFEDKYKRMYLHALKVEEVCDILKKVRGKDVEVLHVQGCCELTDYMVFASGRSTRHLRGMADALVYKVKQCSEGVDNLLPTVEGREGEQWMVVDCGTVITHLFLEETRSYYNLEEFWRHKANSKLIDTHGDFN